MIDKLTITAVLFVFNEERFLPEMLESILRQSVAVDEVIIVDDQSTDDTVGIVSRYALKNSHISYHLNPKKGKVDAYELGLSLVKTDLFFIAAGDDVLLPNFVEGMYQEVIAARKCKFGYARFDKIDELGKILNSASRKDSYDYTDLLTSKCNPLAGYLFGFSEVLETLLPLPSGLPFEDWYTAITLTKRYGVANISPRSMFYYRQHEGNEKRRRLVNIQERNIQLFRILERQEEHSENHEEIQSQLKYFQVLDLLFKQVYGKLNINGLAKLFFSRELPLIQKAKLLLRVVPGVMPKHIEAIERRLKT